MNKSYLIIAALIAVGAIYLFGQQFLQGLGATFEVILNLVGVGLVVGLIAYAGYYLFKSEPGWSNQPGRYIIMVVAALVLSGVSFMTTLFGLLNFVGQDGSGLANQAAPLVISFGTTLGIQSMMFVMAIQLGEMLVSYKPRYGQSTEQPNEKRLDEQDRKLANQMALYRAIGWVLVGVVATGLMYFWGGLDWAGFKSFWTNPTEGSTAMRIVVSLVLLALLLVYAARVRMFGNGWNMMVLLFLLFVYSGTLAVSSLFSFDAYYSLFQSEDDIDRRRESIIREETGSALARVNTSFSDTALEFRTGELATQTRGAVANTIATLVSQSQTRESEIRDSRAAERAQQEAFIDQLQAQAAALEQQIADQQQLTIDNIGARGALELELAQAQDQVQDQEDEIALLQTRIDTLRQAAVDKEIERDQEEAEGTTSGTESGQGPVWRRLNDELTILEGQLATARSELNAAQETLVGLRIEVDTKAAELANLSATIEQATDAESATAQRASLRRQQLEQQLDDALELQRTASAELVALSSFDPGQLSLLFDQFMRAPSPATLENYAIECNTLLNDLTKLLPGDEALLALECVPGEVDAYMSRIQDLERREEAFAAQCGRLMLTDIQPEFSAAEDAATPTDQSAELTSMVRTVRDCLDIGNLGQEEISELSGELTELESAYLSESVDIRRSLNDLWRGSQFAVMAGGGALFIDVLILVVGFLTALNRNTDLYDNPLDPVPLKVEEDLLNAAKFQPDMENEAHAMRKFLEWVRTIPMAKDANEDDRKFRMELRMPPEGHPRSRLVTTIKRAIPDRYVRLDGQRTLLDAQLTNVLQRIAHSQPLTDQELDESESDPYKFFIEPIWDEDEAGQGVSKPEDDIREDPS